MWSKKKESISGNVKVRISLLREQGRLRSRRAKVKISTKIEVSKSHYLKSQLRWTDRNIFKRCTKLYQVWFLTHTVW